MDLVLSLLTAFVLLVVCALRGYFIGYGLLAAMAIVLIPLIRRGFALRDLLHMAMQGGRKSWTVIRILLLIGAVTASWMAAGTVPAIVAYGIEWLNPRYFVLSAFVLSGLVSLLLGTSFGTVGTIGVALMIMAGGSQPHIVAGAIIAGAYFGDRCSPMSSSANLIASVTDTSLYANIRQMVKTTIGPLIAACLVYGGLAVFMPLSATESSLPSELNRLFDLHPIVLLPAGVILGLAAARVPVELAMLLSAATAIGLAVFVQQESLLSVLRSLLLGFRLDEPSAIDAVLRGGGIISMVKVSLIVVLSTAFAGIFAGTRSLRSVERLLDRVKTRSGLFLGTAIIGTAAAAFGCTQTIAILLTQELVQNKYEVQRDPQALAIDLENTVVVISPLIPWNIAGLVPATILMTDFGFIPYAVYLYLIPLINWLFLKRRDALNLCNSRPKKKTNC